MTRIILEYDSDIVNKLSLALGYVPVVYTFNEMFDKYKKSIKKNKKYLATEEMFSLDYTTPLYILKKCIWVDVNDIEKISKLNVLEVC